MINLLLKLKQSNDKSAATAVTDDKPFTDDKSAVTPVTDDKPFTDDKSAATPVTDDKPADNSDVENLPSGDVQNEKMPMIS